MHVRPGSVADLPDALNLLDAAVAWLASQGRTGQWGAEPFSTIEARVEQIRTMLTERTARIAEADGQVVGVCVLAEEPLPYVEPAPIPELYLQLLVTDRARSGSGLGRMLVDDAVEIARQRGATQMRLDCYAGDDQALVRTYEGFGFVLEKHFTVDTGQPEPWPGALLRMEIPAAL
ncbi:GNAT family N-acetyltransferase [Nocardioides sp. NPDC059952]|uniref:GNAT family N-acetyltransferase n=1 Tax=Nocardioides sp. NPDC059952 TaxID=3347014 RepID=UPI003649C611